MNRSLHRLYIWVAETDSKNTSKEFPFGCPHVSRTTKIISINPNSQTPPLRCHQLRVEIIAIPTSARLARRVEARRRVLRRTIRIIRRRRCNHRRERNRRRPRRSRASHGARWIIPVIRARSRRGGTTEPLEVRVHDSEACARGASEGEMPLPEAESPCRSLSVGRGWWGGLALYCFGE